MLHFAIAICAGMAIFLTDMAPTFAAASEATRRACERKANEARPALSAKRRRPSSPIAWRTLRQASAGSTDKDFRHP
jgi:hypothetical protein